MSAESAPVQCGFLQLVDGYYKDQCKRKAIGTVKHLSDRFGPVVDVPVCGVCRQGEVTRFKVS